jgi:hypothetical protein
LRARKETAVKYLKILYRLFSGLGKNNANSAGRTGSICVVG